jgi:hypothetical protein
MNQPKEMQQLMQDAGLGKDDLDGNVTVVEVAIGNWRYLWMVATKDIGVSLSAAQAAR